MGDSVLLRVHDGEKASPIHARAMRRTASKGHSENVLFFLAFMAGSIYLVVFYGHERGHYKNNITKHDRLLLHHRKQQSNSDAQTKPNRACENHRVHPFGDTAVDNVGNCARFILWHRRHVALG